MIYLQGILHDEIDIYTPMLRVMIDKALKKGNALLTTESIIRALKDRSMQLWLIKDNKDIKAICITEILITPTGRVLGIVALTGKDYKQWKDFLEDMLTLYAKEKDCKYIEIHGRKGWDRILNNFKQVAIVLRKEV